VACSICAVYSIHVTNNNARSQKVGRILTVRANSQAVRSSFCYKHVCESS